MGTSIENRGAEEGAEEEVIPWSCVDEVIRQKLITRLNPDQIMSGNNWRGLAGQLGYTTAEIRAIESDKGQNTRVFFDDYDFKKDSSFNEVYRCLKEMERHDCVSILDDHKPRIKENFEKEKRSRLMQNSSGSMGHHSHHQHSMGGTSCGTCSCMPYNSSMPHRGGGPPPPPSCFPSCNSSHHPSHNGAYQGGSCYHMPPPLSHPLSMSSGCMASCSNHSPTKNCSPMCPQQPPGCLPPHLQMDINSFHPPPHPAHMSHHHPNMAFSDRAHNIGGAGVTPNSYQYYSIDSRNPSYSPRVSPENNNKPFNFSVSGSGSYTTALESNRPMSRGGPSNVMNLSHQANHMSGNHNIEQQPNNIFFNKALPDNTTMSQPNSDVSNENNMSFPTSLTQYYDTNKLPPAAHHAPYPSGSQQGAVAAAILSDNTTDMDTKKSLHLQKLTEISKVPNQYQPTNEYKTVVAEQKIENKRQRGRNTRGNGTPSIISSSSGNSTASSSSASSGQSGAKLPRNQPATVPEELRPMAELSIRKSPSVPNNIRPESDSRSISSKVFVTYSRDSEDHKVNVLRLSIFLNDNDISMYADVATDPAAMADTERNIEPYQDYYSQADFVLVCISPKYLEDISRTSPPSSSPTANGSSSGRPIHTYEIYQMMKKEHRHRGSASSMSRSKSPRFVSLLFGDSSPDQMPDWLKKHYPFYQWPSEYESIGWFLKKPRERICAQPYGKN